MYKCDSCILRYYCDEQTEYNCINSKYSYYREDIEKLQNKKDNMDEQTRKYLAFLAKMIWKLYNTGHLDYNDRQSLKNVLSDLDCRDLNEDEFK